MHSRFHAGGRNGIEIDIVATHHQYTDLAPTSEAIFHKQWGERRTYYQRAASIACCDRWSHRLPPSAVFLSRVVLQWLAFLRGGWER